MNDLQKFYLDGALSRYVNAQRYFDEGRRARAQDEIREALWYIGKCPRDEVTEVYNNIINLESLLARGY